MSTRFTTIIDQNGPMSIFGEDRLASSRRRDVEAEISHLERILRVQPLNRHLEQFGDFVLYPARSHGGDWRHGIDGAFQFFGSFKTFDHPFSITTNDPQMIERLTEAICANRDLPGYQWQTPPYVEAHLRIERIPVSETQTEVKLVYDGELIGQFRDHFKVPAGYWHHLAKRRLSQRHYQQLGARANRPMAHAG